MSDNITLTHPALAAEWHPTLNGERHAAQFTAGSNYKAWWYRAACGHAWDATIKSRTLGGNGCPICANKRVAPGINDLATTHPATAVKWHPTLNNNHTPQQYTAGSKHDTWWHDATCGHDYHDTIHHQTTGRGCGVCNGTQIMLGVNDLATTHPLIAAQWDHTANGTLTPQHVTAGSDRKVAWRDQHNHPWVATISSRTNRTAPSGCPICANKKLLIGYNDLATRYPAIAAQWDHAANNGTQPQDYLVGSSYTAGWVDDHGHTWRRPIIGRTITGHGCPTCASHIIQPGFNDLATQYPLIAAKWHPTRNGDLPPTQVSAHTAKMIWWHDETCGHDWHARIADLVDNHGCPVCSGKLVVPGVNDLASQHPAIAAQWHPTFNGDATPDQFTAGSNHRAWWSCDKHEPWHATIIGRTTGYGCTTCANEKYTSKAEDDIYAYIKTLGVNPIAQDRKTLHGQELDIYIPTKNLAIEYNGLYYHTEQFGKDKTYHHNKWLAAKNAGIQLLQIWSDDWQRNPDLIMTMLTHKLGLSTQPKIYARKTTIASITKQQAEPFLNTNHIQGYASGSHYLGLHDQTTNALTACLVLKKEPNNTLNIIRYATNANVIGGFTKLLAHAEKTYKPTRFITFADHTVSDGSLYANNGFTPDKELPPDYMYVKNGVRHHKFGYRLNRFRTDPTLQYVAGMTERELAMLNNLPRIWDAGKTRWAKTVSPTA